MTEAQNQLVGAIAGICPHVLYPTVATASLPTMTVAAALDIATFGTDSNGYNITPIGKTTLYRSLNDYPTSPMILGVDYLPTGGTTVRAPNNGTLPSTIYWVGITNPPDIDATHQPSLFPEASRDLISRLAVFNFAEGGGRNPELATLMGTALGYPFFGDKGGAFSRWCTTWRTQFRGGGALRSFTGMQVALGSQYNNFA